VARTTGKQGKILSTNQQLLQAGLLLLLHFRIEIISIKEPISILVTNKNVLQYEKRNRVVCSEKMIELS